MIGRGALRPDRGENRGIGLRRSAQLLIGDLLLRRGTAFSCKPLRSCRSRVEEKYVLDGERSPRPTPSDSGAAMAAHDGMLS